MVRVDRNILPLLAILLFVAGCAAPQRTVRIFPPDDQLVTVIYPRATENSTFLAPADSIIFKTAPDSLFLFGKVEDPNGRLEVNNRTIPIHPDGGWLAWVARGNVLPLPVDSPYHPGNESVVTIRYETASYVGQEIHRTSRRIHFVTTGPQGIDPVELEFHPQEMRLKVTVDNAKLRCGNPGTYDAFPQRGTVLIADGWQGIETKRWRIPLSQERIGWIDDSMVSVDPPLVYPEPSLITKAMCEVDGRITRVVIPIDQKKLYRVDHVDENRLELVIFDAVSATDIILQPTESRAVDEIRWSQQDGSTYCLTAYIRPEWFWGWDDGFDNDGNLVWQIIEAPEIGKKPLEGLIIVTDPGHGGDQFSAIGPTGLMEKDANQMLGEAMNAELRKGGAKVYPTRTKDVTLGLLDRIEFANRMKADMLISLHHNALPQGVNPALHRGASLHYYQRHSLPMAEAVYRAISDGDWHGDGVRYQDLAMTRPSFCPSVLLEAGFMLHPEEEVLFKTPEHHQWISMLLRTGLEEYLTDLRQQQQESLKTLRVR